MLEKIKKISKMESSILYNQIENNLIALFDKECPQDTVIMINKEEILNEFNKWMNFWVTKNPSITNTNISTNNETKNQLLYMKKHICETKIVNIFKELEKIGLCKEFKEKYTKL